MSVLNLDLLIKLLKMTTSSSDGEALVAMRKANEQVAKLKTDWDSLLRSKVTIIADPFANSPVPSRDKVRRNPQPPPMHPPSKPQQTRQPRPFSSVHRPGAQPSPAYAAKSAQPRAARRKNPITLDDLL